MTLPDNLTARIRRSLDELYSAELGETGGALYEAVSPILLRAFQRGIEVGISLTATASGQGIDALRSGLQEQQFVAPNLNIKTRPAARRPRTRANRSGKNRAAPGAVGQAIDLVLADSPGSRIVEIQQMAVELDPTISASSVTNELRRYLGKRYRQDGKRWYRIGDTGSRTVEGGTSSDEADLWAERPVHAAA